MLGVSTENNGALLVHEGFGLAAKVGVGLRFEAEAMVGVGSRVRAGVRIVVGLVQS